MSTAYVEFDKNNQSKCTTFNFEVPTIWPIWVILVIVIAAIVVHYLITFRIWNVRPTENFTNCDYCNQNNYYEQYQ